MGKLRMDGSARFVVCCFSVLGISLLGTAQTQDSHSVTIQISSIAALNIVGGNVTLAVGAPGTGGASPINSTDNSCYLQYTSSIAVGQSRSITAAWGGTDAAPTGCLLKLDASPVAGEGNGTGQITLSGTAQNISTGIERCATGTGGTDGAQLNYTLNVDSVTDLTAGESRLATLTFTLTDSS